MGHPDSSRLQKGNSPKTIAKEIKSSNKYKTQSINGLVYNFQQSSGISSKGVHVSGVPGLVGKMSGGNQKVMVQNQAQGGFEFNSHSFG